MLGSNSVTELCPSILPGKKYMCQMNIWDDQMYLRAAEFLL